MTDTKLTIYTREDCHLCETAIETCRRVGDAVSANVTVDVVDVDGDSDLRARYGERVPYVLVDGRPTFKYRVDEAELRRKLRS
jgi:glutaredoxin